MASDLSHDRNLGLAVYYLPVSELKPYERNARTHSRKQIKKIADSIEAFGFTNPVLIDANNTIVAGHGRVEAAKTLGLATIPTIRLDHLTDNQRRAYILADNKLAEKAGWDKAILAIELQHLLAIEADLNIELTGFEESEIGLIIEDLVGSGDEDTLPAPATDLPTITKAGDCWILENHRVMCGDATNSTHFETLLDGQTASMTFTDPPYNVDYASEDRNGKQRPILNDDLGKNFRSFLEGVCRNIVTKTDGAIYICMSSSELHTLQSAFVGAGGHWSTFLIWVKNTFTLGRSDYQRQYEPILYGWREKSPHYWCGARNQGDVWFFDKPSHNDLHPTMKPVSLVISAIRNSSNKNDIVLDPFLGSGTTLLAAERTKRVCYGLELDPRYVDVAVDRWERHTSRKAVHAVTGQLFSDLKNKEKIADG